MITILKKLFGAKEVLVQRLFTDVLKEYIETYLRENVVVQATKDRYDVYWRNYNLFAASHRYQNLKIDQIRLSHAEEFRAWLRLNLKTCTVRHASRHLELLKRVTRYAIQREYIVQDFLEPIKAQKNKPKKIVSLEMSELKKLSVYQFHSQLMRMTADLFLFQCFTGLSYSDIYRFELTTRNGKLWLEGNRAKTNEPFMVYVFPEAMELLEKYEFKMPKLSNQKYNQYLKEIADMVGIKKYLTTHIGRKTHATILAEAGAGTKSISLQLANTPRVCDESYINKTPVIIENEVLRLGLDRGLLA